MIAPDFGIPPKNTTSEPAMNGPTAATMRPTLKQKPTPVARSRVGNSHGNYGVKVPRMPLVIFGNW